MRAVTIRVLEWDEDVAYRVFVHLWGLTEEITILQSRLPGGLALIYTWGDYPSAALPWPFGFTRGG